MFLLAFYINDDDVGLLGLPTHSVTSQNCFRISERQIDTARIRCKTMKTKWSAAYVTMLTRENELYKAWTDDISHISAYVGTSTLCVCIDNDPYAANYKRQYSE